jgi:hypothetical protein
MSIAPVMHRLSLAVRPIDHFTREPVPQELPLRIADDLRRPIHAPGGSSRRQVDGAYRFVDLPAGPARILWREPFTRSHGGWMRIGDDPVVTLPLADPLRFVDIEFWPAAHAAAAPSATGVRGKLVGAKIAQQRLRIAPPGEPFDRYTQSDATGEFLFMPPGRLTVDADGAAPLRIEVRAADGTPRVVASSTVVSTSPASVFPGADFNVPARIVSRVIFQLA